MTDYTKSKIYKLVSDQTPDVFYGSTVSDLRICLNHHRSKYDRFLRGDNGYSPSFKLAKHDDFHIELVESYICYSSRELKERLQYHINKNKCVNKKTNQ